MAKKFEFINNPEWDDCEEFNGVIPGLLNCYNFEVEKDGKVSFMSTKEDYRSPEDFASSAEMKQLLEFFGLRLTGRIVFRGYFQEVYDEVYDECYLEKV